MQNLTREIEVCEEVETKKATKDIEAVYETQCHNETEEYQESIETEDYLGEETIGLMADELDEDLIKDQGESLIVNLYSVIAKNFVDIGKLFDRVEELEGGNVTKLIGTVGTNLITFLLNPEVSTESAFNETTNQTTYTNFTTYNPTISTLNTTNLTITSSGGSVIIKLGS